MSQTNRFALTFETLAELSSEIGSAHVDPSPVIPKLSEVLAEFSPMPRGSLFLGVASDGLPILLNLLDPLPGPLLIAGDKHSGKTKLLQIISQSIAHVPASHAIKFVTLSNYPQEWNALHYSNCEGILSISERESERYLARVVEWAHAKSNDRDILVLLIDDFTALLASDEVRQYLRWLLLRGPSRRVWPFVTINPDQTENLSSWLGAFRTRLFGHMEEARMSKLLTGMNETIFGDLIPGSQFAIREGESWLPFWIPQLD